MTRIDPHELSRLAQKVLDHGYVKFIESWGSDERIIEAARMSTDGAFRGWGTSEKPGDEKLLRYLWTNGHTSPFEQAGMTVEIQAPIFVFRQLVRHRTLSLNELSARYTEMPDLFYVPSVERLMSGGQGTTNKQGSGEKISETTAEVIRIGLSDRNTNSRSFYKLLIEQGLSRELARIVLPVSQYSRMRVSANLWNWTRFLRARLHDHAQWEIRQFAEAVGVLVLETFPRTWEMFKEDVQ